MTKLQEELEAESMNELEWQCQSQMNEDPIARRVSQVRTMRSSHTRKQKIAKTENHNVTMKHTQRKNSRTSSHEDKVEMEYITSKYKVVNYVDKKFWSGTQISSR